MCARTSSLIAAPAARSSCQSGTSATAATRLARIVEVAWPRLRRSWLSCSALAAATGNGASWRSCPTPRGAVGIPRNLTSSPLCAAEIPPARFTPRSGGFLLQHRQPPWLVVLRWFHRRLASPPARRRGYSSHRSRPGHGRSRTPRTSRCAGRAHLAGGLEPTDLGERAAISGRFLLDALRQLSPAGIGDRLGQLGADHA